MSKRDVAFLEFAHRVEEGAGGCADGRPWGVVNDDGDVVSCHATEEDAQAAAEAADEGGDTENAPRERRAFMVLAVEGFETGDGRVLEVDGWNDGSLRMPPLPLMIQTENPEWGGHAGAFVGGRIDRIERMDDGRRLYAEGAVQTANDQGQWVESQIESQNLRFVSIDVGQADVEYEVREMDEDGWPTDVLARFDNYEIMGATVVPFPAIAWAVIWLEGMEPPAEFTASLPDAPERVDVPEVVPSEAPSLLLASGRNDDGLPPATWFDDPELSELTHLTVENGRVYGHLAGWGTCHIGMPGCVTAPDEPDYSHFATGETIAFCDCAEADDRHQLRIATGVITLGTSHAERGLSAREAAWHYDHTGAAVADVAAGVDEHGIWLAGAVRAGVTEEQMRQLRAADISGDWRSIGGQLRLVGALACNVAGFPIPRAPQAHLVASGGQLRQTALIAPMGTPRSGQRRYADDPRFESLHRSQLAMQAEIKRLRAIADPLEDLAADAIVASLRPAAVRQ